MKEGLDEMEQIRKTTLFTNGEKIEKPTLFPEEQKEIFEKLGLEDRLFTM